MRNSYEVRAQRFIKEIYPYIQGCNSHFQREVAVAHYNHQRHRNVHYYYGMTRFALITSDYAIKINYNPEEIAKFGGGEEEIELYEQAEADGMEYLFAKITRFEYQDMIFYIMPRISGIGSDYHDAWYYMNEEEMDWCNDHDIYDLHCQNYGWKNGHIVIIDYGAHDQWALTRRPAEIVYSILKILCLTFKKFLV